MSRRALFAGMAAVLLAACTTTDKVVEPVWGKEPCAHCAMVLTDKHFGAELVTSDGERFFFDDVGCMVLFVEERHVPLTHAWVHDAETGTWLDARTARFRAGATSPMDFGFDAREGVGVSWDEMRDHVLAKSRRVP
jgi:copper chaperone NosL